jgi:multidrug/hemolysin transport system permease protein
MGNIAAFTRRNIALFLRDRAAVFFSFLSAIILVALYFLFIGKNYADTINIGLNYLLSSDAIYAIVYVQMIVGVLALNSLSLSVGVFMMSARDFETRRVDSFLLTPVKPTALLTAYFLGGFVASFILNLLTWLLSVVVIGALFGYWVGAGALLMVVAALLFASFISCAFMLLFTAIVKSSAAIGVFSGVAGTFFGFLCGIYMPYATLGKGAETVGSVLPFTHVAILMKKIVLADAFGALGVAENFHAPMAEGFSTFDIGLAGIDIPLWGTAIYATVVALACLAAAGILLGGRLKRRGGAA